MLTILILFFYLLVTDRLFAVALGAARLYREPEVTMTYPDYIRRIACYSRPYTIVCPLSRYVTRVRKTRHYALYMMCASVIFAVVYVLFQSASYYNIIPVILVSSLLQAMCYTDMRTRFLPDIFMLPAVFFSVIIACTGMYLPVMFAFIGGAAGFGIMWGINALYKLIRKRDGMGGGDFVLMGLLGLWVGPYALPYVLFLSSFAGLAGACLYALCMGKGMPQRFAYGPALAFAGWGVFLAMQTELGREFFLIYT